MSAPRRALPAGGAAAPGVEQSGRPHSSRRLVPPIHVRGLRKRFGSAGKTTTLRMLVGLATPTAGTATLGDQAYAELDNPQRVVACVLEPGFHPGRSGRNHLRVLATTASVDDARVDELLELVGLTDAARRPAGGYSLGMRQRLALAGALLGDPDYLILDEPANGLDPEGIRWLRAFLRGFVAGGRTVLVSSHLLGEVQASVDDVVVIGRGRLLRQAPISELQVGGGGLTVLFFIQQWNVPLNLMPSGATNAMLGVTSPVLFASPEPWPWWAGLLVLAGWCLLPAALGILITVRRDVA